MFKVNNIKSQFSIPLIQQLLTENAYIRKILITWPATFFKRLHEILLYQFSCRGILFSDILGTGREVIKIRLLKTQVNLLTTNVPII